MLCLICTPEARGPDMHTRSPRAGPRASGVHIRQSTRACVTTTKCIMCSTKPWQIAAQKHYGGLATLDSKSARIKDAEL